MREIKFRAWDKEEEKYWTHVISEMGDNDLYNGNISMWLVGYMMEHGDDSSFIFEQFTGLYAGVFGTLCGDKEYDEIYEGDKISVTYATQGMSNSHEHTITGVVAFKYGSFVVEWDFPKKGKYKHQTLNSVKRLGDCGVVIKVIGNIHD